jgi:hypothetical protein
MTSTFKNEFHRYEKTIRHRGDVPALSTIRRHIRAARPNDCRSPYTITREDGATVAIIPSNDHWECWRVVAFF